MRGRKVDGKGRKARGEAGKWMGKGGRLVEREEGGGRGRKVDEKGKKAGKKDEGRRREKCESWIGKAGEEK